MAVYFFAPIFLLVVAYAAALLFTSKGHLLHELAHLPVFWWAALSGPGEGIAVSKIFYGALPRQYFLLCLPPAGAQKRRHAIVYFHGGGWRYGRPEQFRRHASLLAGKGYIVFLPSYRRTPRYRFPDIRQDLRDMLPVIQGALARQQPDCAGLLIGGMSAGGHVAALAVFSRAAKGEKPSPGPPLCGLFALAAPLHLAAMRDTLTVRNFAGPRSQPQFLQASPMHYLQEPVNIPTLIIHGDKDGMVEYPTVAHFADKLKKVNAAETTFFTLKEGTHLDVASWVSRAGEVRQHFFDWLDRMEHQP